MAEQKRRKGGGAKLSRSQTVTVRLDPQLRYMADLAARSQRRTLSSFVEWAIAQALGEVPLKDHAGESATARELVDRLWDVDEPDRFILLAVFNSDLLTHEEQLLFKRIKEMPEYWSTDMYSPSILQVSIGDRYILIDKLRANWNKVKEYGYAL